jgi:hypothetical protein
MSDPIRVQVTDNHDPRYGEQYDTDLGDHMVQTDLERGRLTRVARIFTAGGRVETMLVSPHVQAEIDAGHCHEVHPGEDGYNEVKS